MYVHVYVKLILVKSADNAKWLLSGLGLWVVGLSQLCSVFDQLCYSIMLHFLINYASKVTNYASYMTNYSHIKIVNL